MKSRRLSARTVRYTHAVLRSALDHAPRWKLLRENPAVDLPLPRADRKEYRVFTPEQARRFVMLCGQDPRGLILWWRSRRDFSQATILRSARKTSIYGGRR